VDISGCNRQVRFRPKADIRGVIAMSADRNRAKFLLQKRPEFYRWVGHHRGVFQETLGQALMDPNTLGVLAALSIVAISVAIAFLLFALLRR